MMYVDMIFLFIRSILKRKLKKAIFSCVIFSNAYTTFFNAQSKTWVYKKKKIFKKAKLKFVVGDPIYLANKENEKPSSRGRFGVEIHASRLKGDPLFYPMEVGFRIFNKFVHEGRLTIQMKRRGIQIMLKDGKPEQIRTCLNVLAAFLRKRRESTATRSSENADARSVCSQSSTTSIPPVVRGSRVPSQTPLRTKRLQTLMSRVSDKNVSRRRGGKTTRRPPVRTPEGKVVKRKSKRKEEATTRSSSTPSPPKCTSKGQRLTQEQRSIIRATRKGSNIFFTGSAGTGKSLLLRHLRDTLPSSSTYVTATTGVAACAIGGTTLHHFAGTGAIEPTSTVSSLASRVLKNSSACKRWKRVKILIVDEISMLSATVFQLLEALARRLRSNDKAFGGIQLIMCGDFFQLPPVEIVKNKTSSKLFCFESKAWRKCVRPEHQFELTKIFRQSNTEFCVALNEIRKGVCTEKVKLMLQSRVDADLSFGDGILPTIITTHRKDVDRINKKSLEKLTSATTRLFHAVDTGTNTSEYRQFKSSCRAREKITLKIGAQVMLVRSIAPNEGLFNGARGVVTKFIGEGERCVPVVRFAGIDRDRVISREVWQVRVGDRVVATRTQIPLALAWALSVHKSQGMTLNRAVLNLSKVFEPGQFYVALSRVRSLSGLSIVGKLKTSCIRASSAVRKFYKTMQKGGRDDGTTVVQVKRVVAKKEEGA